MSMRFHSVAAVWARVALLSSVALVAGCGGGPARNPFDGTTPGPAGDRIRVEVQNLNFNDATVWALRASQRIRVGRVTGKTDQNFTLQWTTAAPIAFEIDIVSGRSCRTSAVAVESESRVWVTIPSDLGYGACRAGRR